MAHDDDTGSLRSPRNEYDGYAYGPMKRTGDMRLRLDFNARIRSEDEVTKLEGFSLRIMERPEDVQFPERRGEYGITMTVEQWQDLISAMQEELELARKWRGQLEDVNQGGDDWVD